MRALVFGVLLSLAACGGAGGPVGADLSGLRIARVRVDEQAFEVWIAETPGEQAQGLMEATASQLVPTPDGTPRGMLFRFAEERLVAFTMRDTWVPLDLAHFSAEGDLLEILELEPLDATPIPSTQPVRYSLEVPRGVLGTLGIGPGSRLALPLP